AQIGNWKSWDELEWKVKNCDGDQETVCASDLLKRTVFYKVGHHGSHNATLKEGGLERMTSPNLVVAIPVDQAIANNTKHWEMPAEVLYERLKVLTKARILRPDYRWPTPEDTRPEELKAAEWENFLQAVTLDPQGMFIDYHIL